MSNANHSAAQKTTARLVKMLALAAGAALLGNAAEAATVRSNAEKIAARAGLDLDALTVDVSLASLLGLEDIEWTNEMPPSDPFRPEVFQLADGTWIEIAEFITGSGTMVTHFESETGVYEGSNKLHRGFWRDMPAQEAVWLARDAWGC
jgi:hypothetical protein